MHHLARKLILLSFFFWSPVVSSAEPIQAGEGYVTRFSGTINQGKLLVLDLQGTVGSIIDVRYPRVAPMGQHWLNEPQRVPILAKDAGQIFGIAIDDKTKTIYVTATAKFGLHRNAANSEWLPGMWGKGGGAGTVYRLKANNDYQPEVFTNITLEGRNNTGAALGNVVFDAKNRQLFVSDLETGMIHQINAINGKLLGFFDHGQDGRSVFTDKLSGKVMSLPILKFDPSSQANIDKCPTKFDNTPSCWNLAAPIRRVWGLGIYTSPKGMTRLYYGVMSESEEKKNPQGSIWSIGLDKQGNMNIQDVQREFLLPFNHDKTHQLAISDIAFSQKGDMLVAENGRLRNLGLDKTEPFSKPYDARLFLFTQSENGTWALKGRYDVGNLSNQPTQKKPEFNDVAGGTDFNYGYTKDFTIDLSKPDQYVWVTGDALCTPEGPCFDVSTESYTDEDEVHGIQGMKATNYITLDQAMENFFTETYMIDTDINVLADGTKSNIEAKKDDATKIGDIEFTKPLEAPPAGPLHSTKISTFHYKYESGIHNRLYSTPLHARNLSHTRWGSHRKSVSHYRLGSHDLLYSHFRYGSHYRLDSHYRFWSHDRLYSHRKFSSHSRTLSHNKYASHGRNTSHLRFGSHKRNFSHYRLASHDLIFSHFRYGSHFRLNSHFRMWSHDRIYSHRKYNSHLRTQSHNKYASHGRKASHLKVGSHSRKGSHLKVGSHGRKASHIKVGSHARKASHLKYGSHARKASHLKYGSHARKASHLKYGSHGRKASHLKYGSHGRKASHLKYGSHGRKASHRKVGSHKRHASHRKYGSHGRKASHRKYGSHKRHASHRKIGSHKRRASHRKYGSHARRSSHRKIGSHSRRVSHARGGSHNRRASHARGGSHNRTLSNVIRNIHNRSASHNRRGSHQGGGHGHLE